MPQTPDMRPNQSAPQEFCGPALTWQDLAAVPVEPNNLAARLPGALVTARGAVEGLRDPRAQADLDTALRTVEAFVTDDEQRHRGVIVTDLHWSVWDASAMTALRDEVHDMFGITPETKAGQTVRSTLFSETGEVDDVHSTDVFKGELAPGHPVYIVHLQSPTDIRNRRRVIVLDGAAENAPQVLSYANAYSGKEYLAAEQILRERFNASLDELNALLNTRHANRATARDPNELGQMLWAYREEVKQAQTRRTLGGRAI